MTRAVAVGCLLAAVASSAAGPWPRFRGPNGSGICEDAHIPLRFGASENLLWQVAIPGSGNGSPVVWGERVFLQTAASDGSDRRLLCLHSRSGKLLWEHREKAQPAHAHRKNTLASSTPAVDKDRVCVVFWDGSGLSLHAFTHDGKTLWKHPLGSFASQHGAGHSPILHDDVCIVVNDQDGAACVYALDARTGDLLWRMDRPAFRACYSTPVIRETASGETEVIVASTAGVSGYRLKDGSENWRWTWHFARAPLRTVGSPVLGKEMVFATSGDGAGDRHAVALRLGGKGDVTGSALVWESHRLFSYVPTMLVHGEHLYFVNDNGIAACFEAATGKSLWTQRIGGNVSASPILVNGSLYAATEEGEVVVFAADPASYRELARNALDDPIFATPAVADGRLYVRTRRYLFCFGKPEDR
jgi:outer membrane protein assembly factor BamB